MVVLGGNGINCGGVVAEVVDGVGDKIGVSWRW